MQVNVPKFFKDFEGSVTDFRDYLDNLLNTDYGKWEEITRSIVFIHSSGAGEAIYANGHYYTNSSSSGIYKVQYYEIPPDSSVINTLIESEVPGYYPQDGHICVVKVDAHDDRPETYLTYVFDEDNNSWHMTDVPADHIYFYNGIQRTEAWGTKAASPQMITECVGMNLEQLLKYFLVEHRYANPTASWNIVEPHIEAFFDSIPNQLSVNWNGVSEVLDPNTVYVKEVGTTISNNAISWNPSLFLTGHGTSGGEIVGISQGPAVVEDCIYGANVDARWASLNGSTIEGLYRVQQIPNWNITAQANLALELDGYEVDSPVVNLNVQGNYPTSIAANSFSTTLLEGAATLSLRYDLTSTNVLQVAWSTGTINGVGSSDYLSNMGDATPCSTLSALGYDSSYNNTPVSIDDMSYLPDWSQVVTVNAIPDMTFTIHSVYPIYTNGVAYGDTGCSTEAEAILTRAINYGGGIGWFTKSNATGSETTAVGLDKVTDLFDYLNMDTSSNLLYERWYVFGFGNSSTDGWYIYVPYGAFLNKVYTIDGAGCLSDTTSTAAGNMIPIGSTVLDSIPYRVYAMQVANIGASIIMVSFTLDIT